jgi:two-component system, OmpR family, sensor kinase
VRETAVLVVAVLVAMAALSTVALRTVITQQQDTALATLGERASVLLRTRQVETATVDQMLAVGPVGSFVIGFDADDRVLFSDVPLGVDPVALLGRARGAGAGRPVSLEGSSTPIRATMLDVDDIRPLFVAVDGRPVRVATLVFGFDTSRGERLLLQTALLEIALLVLAGALIVLLLPRTVARGLAPLEAMTDAAQAVAAGDSARRLPADVPVAETLGLADAVNEALDARQDAETRMRQFVADASHELRTPLTTIEGWAELHRQGGLDDPELLGRALDRISASAAHLTMLVEDLALLARLDAGRPVERRPVDLGALTDAVVDDIRVIDPSRAVTVTRPVDGEPGAVVRGDENRLRQVLLNLTGNALQHTPEGTPIAVEVRRDAGRVVLSVSDRGPGIPTEQQSRIFDRFYRGSPHRSPGGTGLGLAIVRSLVDAHGGTVGLVSGSGGTRFTVTLPADPPA